ncbi:MAG: hypothetical protein IJJ60_05075 [Clostridia bacterium]|nr:hypothetical protein [Clostridia bacterium]
MELPDYKSEWAEARDRLRTAVSALGYPSDLADLLSRELGSPRGIDRLTSYIHHAKPRSLEMIVDEMLAIKGQIDAWREKKESEEAQAAYNARLFARRGKHEDEE